MVCNYLEHNVQLNFVHPNLIDRDKNILSFYKNTFSNQKIFPKEITLIVWPFDKELVREFFPSLLNVLYYHESRMEIKIFQSKRIDLT